MDKIAKFVINAKIIILNNLLILLDAVAMHIAVGKIIIGIKRKCWLHIYGNRILNNIWVPIIVNNKKIIIYV